MQLTIRTTPNARKFSVKIDGNTVKVYVSEKAEDGKANLELVKNLRKLLGAEVQLVRGHKSRIKTIEVNADEETVWRILESASK